MNFFSRRSNKYNSFYINILHSISTSGQSSWVSMFGYKSSTTKVIHFRPGFARRKLSFVQNSHRRLLHDHLRPANRVFRAGERIGEGLKMKSATSPGEGCAAQAGFTLAELLVVASIIVIVIGMSIPNLSRAIDNAKLKGATQTLVAVYQDARMRATQSNTPYEVLLSPAGVRPAQVCVDLNGDGVCNASDPVTPIPGRVSLSNGV